jgi:acetate kinase
MNILVLDCGSSTIEAAVVDHRTGERFLTLRVVRLGEPRTGLSIDGGPEEFCPGESHDEALAHVLHKVKLRLSGQSLHGVGHRVVHGGTRFSMPTVIDDAVESAIDALSDLAPLHNPENLAGIRSARHLLPDVPHVAVFDTAFHATLPSRARAYALPLEIVESWGLRRYGFHGTSHSWATSAAAEYLDANPRNLRLITCHLGDACSVTAVEYGRSVETSMGMTPLEGLVMGTRSGDVDPGILLALLRDGELDVETLDDLLHRDSGLAGLSGVGTDMNDIEERAAEGDERCRLAVQVFTHRLRKYIGAYGAVMGGADAIVFTGGIGERSALVRHRACHRLGFMGAHLDEDRNRDARVHRVEEPVVEISSADSRAKLLVVASDEERQIAHEVAALLQQRHQVARDRAIPIAVSSRHVHLTQEAADALFGKGSELHLEKELTQPGMFAAWERVTLVGPKGSVEGARVIGPLRDHTQVEISRTDEFTLGIDAPVRMSGYIANTPGITMRGPGGDYTTSEGVICHQRHIHMTPQDAERLGVRHLDVVEVTVAYKGRDVTFDDVVIRVGDSSKLELHIDVEEANASELGRLVVGVLTSIRATARLSRRDTRYDRPDEGT